MDVYYCRELNFDKLNAFALPIHIKRYVIEMRTKLIAVLSVGNPRYER